MTSLYLAYKKYCICSYHVDHNDPKTLNKHILQYLWHQIKIRVASPSTFTARKMSFTNRLFYPVFLFLSASVDHPPSPFHSRKPNIFTPKTIPRKRGRILPPLPPNPRDILHKLNFVYTSLFASAILIRPALSKRTILVLAPNYWPPLCSIGSLLYVTMNWSPRPLSSSSSSPAVSHHF